VVILWIRHKRFAEVALRDGHLYDSVALAGTREQRQELTMFAYGFALLERMKAGLAVARGDRKGLTAPEYGLLVALIAAAIIVALRSVATSLSVMFSTVAGKL
jgi:pilus assembly protein Flp/PilA